MSKTINFRIIEMINYSISVNKAENFTLIKKCVTLFLTKFTKVGTLQFSLFFKIISKNKGTCLHIKLLI